MAEAVDAKLREARAVSSAATTPPPPPAATTVDDPKRLSDPPPPRENMFRTLPAEIILRILAHLSPHELVQSAACCREWYFIASDPILWRTLDLSFLRSDLFNPKTASTLTRRLQSCRNFSLKEPPSLNSQHVAALLHFLSSSPMLEQLTLHKLGSCLNSHFLEIHFRMSRSNRLMHVDLSHSPVTTAAVVALMQKHHSTLRTLDLSHTSIGDGTLRAVSTAKVLHTLDISSCTSISRTSIRNFLTKRCPTCLTTLSLRGLGEVKITWLHDLFRLPAAANLRMLDVEGCERLTLGDLKGLASAYPRVEVRHDAREVADSVWGYRRYIEFLAQQTQGVPEKLEDVNDDVATAKEVEKKLMEMWAMEKGKSAGSGSNVRGPGPPPPPPTPPPPMAGTSSSLVNR